MSNVLIIGDTHAPCMRKDYVPFLKKTYEKYKCNKVVHIGDLVDWCAISYHPKDPSLMDSRREFHAAKKQVQQLYRAFPKATWLIGNHDCLPSRRASDIGLPSEVMQDYATLWGVHDWEVIPRYGQKEIDGVLYQHGDRGRSGQINGAFLNAQEEHKSVVQGHLHAQMAVNYFANNRTRLFGMQTGSGCDSTALAQDYGKKYNKKPLLGCGIVLNGVTAIVEPMKL
jgi:predicted phosphodiesterase